jgi:hypothetical protein
MAVSPHTSPFVFGTFIAVTCIASSAPFAHAAAAADPVRVTSVANATVRTAPSPDAPAIAQLPLGTEVQEAGPAGLDKTWLLVRLTDAREGWLQTRLTKPLDPVWRTEAYDAIIADRLSRKGDGFTALAELVSFIDRAAPVYGDAESRAHVELARLRALSLATAAIPFGNARREPYASWLAAQQSDVVYDEPGGQWIVRNTSIWDVHTKYRGTTVADDIAWFAVTTGLSGECEGNIACYFAAQNMLNGEYLRAHPFGRHAVEAVGAVATMVDTVTSSGQVRKPYDFNRKEDCAQLTFAVDGLSSAIHTAKGAGWESMLANLSAVRKLCQ